MPLTGRGSPVSARRGPRSRVEMRLEGMANAPCARLIIEPTSPVSQEGKQEKRPYRDGGDPSLLSRWGFVGCPTARDYPDRTWGRGAGRSPGDGPSVASSSPSSSIYPHTPTSRVSPSRIGLAVSHPASARTAQSVTAIRIMVASLMPWIPPARCGIRKVGAGTAPVAGSVGGGPCGPCHRQCLGLGPRVLYQSSPAPAPNSTTNRIAASFPLIHVKVSGGTVTQSPVRRHPHHRAGQGPHLREPHRTSARLS